MDLARLINKRISETGGSYRSMEKRAKDAGHSISRSTINSYAKGRRDTHPSEETIAALTAALDLPYVEVAAAVHESFGVDAGDTVARGRSVQQANAWLRLTEGRTEAEIEHLMKVVEILLEREDAVNPERRSSH